MSGMQKKRWMCVLLALSICLHPLAVRAESAGEDALSTQDSDEGDTRRISTLVIDNQNVYEGMDRPYAEGYVPRVEGGNVLVVIPLRLEGEGLFKNNTLRASLNLGDTSNTPFMYRNYDKSITLSSHPVNNGTGTAESFLASFQLELLPERYNGSYPVTLAVEGMDQAGTVISQNFVVYVTITDGKDPNAVPEEPEAEPVPEEPPTFTPKLLVESYRYTKKAAPAEADSKDSHSQGGQEASEILAGDQITAEITLRNTSSSQRIKNMTVTVSAPEEQLTLLSPTDSVYIESVPAGETCTVTLDYLINISASAGQYNLELTMDYADTDGAVYTGSGKAKLSVKQPIEMQFDPVVLPDQLEVGDITEVQVQAMNLGRSKVYNVRAELYADGLSPQGTIFIGDMEPGTMMRGSTQIAVGSLLDGDSMYGETEGTMTFYYEDETGNEQTQELTFTTTISSPFSDKPTEPEDEPGQWWVIMAVIGLLLLACVAVLIIRKIKRRRLWADGSDS